MKYEKPMLIQKHPHTVITTEKNISTITFKGEVVAVYDFGAAKKVVRNRKKISTET